MQVLALKNEGEAWQQAFKIGDPTTIEVLVIATVAVQLALLGVAIAFMMSFTKQGLSWSNQQVALRSKDFFLIVACVVVPVLATFFILEYVEGHNKLASLPRIQKILIADSHVLGAKIIILLYFVLSYFAFLSMVFKSHWMMEKYVML